MVVSWWIVVFVAQGISLSMKYQSLVVFLYVVQHFKTVLKQAYIIVQSLIGVDPKSDKQQIHVTALHPVGVVIHMGN